MEPSNPRLIYQSLLAETDAEAREDYTYDPRVRFFAERNFEKDPDTFEQSKISATILDTDENVETLSGDALIDTLTLPVQDQPDMREKTRIIIIDTTMRDWTIQPDAYSNVFTFGSKRYVEYANAQVPYYFNNPTIPLDAYEVPTNFLNTGIAQGSRGDIPDIPNNKPQPFPSGVPLPSYLNRINSNLVYPTYGWKIVLSGGQRIHSPDAFSYGDPNIQVFFYPTFDAREPRGAQIGIDIQPKRYGVTGYSFYTETMMSNITKIRLARAVIPVTSLQPYRTSAFSVSLEYPDSIQSKPYLLMSIDSIKGGYYGGAGTTVQTAFTALIQNDRTIYEGGSKFPSQFIDYKPWADEVYTFDPPISKLSNANIRLYTSYEQVLSHLDNLNIVDMVILNGNDLGKIKFFITQNTGTINDFGISNIFTNNDIRVGDEITFYIPSITSVRGDPSDTGVLSGVFELLSNDFLVTDVCEGDFSPPGVLPIVSYGTSFTAAPKIYGNLDGMVSIYNTLSTAANTLSQICLQQYTAVSPVDLQFAQQRTFSKDYVIPILNTNLQPTYAFEITTLEPDTTKLQKIIPN